MLRLRTRRQYLFLRDRHDDIQDHAFAGDDKTFYDLRRPGQISISWTIPGKFKS
jgi:hypothetical protein